MCGGGGGAWGRGLEKVIFFFTKNPTWKWKKNLGVVGGWVVDGGGGARISDFLLLWIQICWGGGVGEGAGEG